MKRSRQGGTPPTPIEKEFKALVCTKPLENSLSLGLQRIIHIVVSTTTSGSPQSKLPSRRNYYGLSVCFQS